MALTEDYVRSLFAKLEQGDPDAFFERVADDVHWLVMGTHPLAGTYTDKQRFRERTFGRLSRVLAGGLVLEVTNVLVSGEHAVVEMISHSTALDGRAFDNVYCWVCRFDGDVIVAVRAYVDSALVQQVLDANESREQ